MNKKIIAVVSILFVALIILYRVMENDEINYILPEKLVEGENKLIIDNYILEDNGLKVFKDLINKSEEINQDYIVDYFSIELNNKGAIDNFSLYLDMFDENNEYYGETSYSFADDKLIYTPPEETYSEISIQFNENSTLDYLDEEIKKIPINEQIKVCGLDKYIIKNSQYKNVDSGTPIFDGMNVDVFPVLNKDDYNAGKGGKSDGKTNVTFMLYDGSSLIDGQIYYYVSQPINPEKAIGDQMFTMKCDYLLLDGKMKFTRNYGAEWKDIDISEEKVYETLEFNRSWIALPSQSIFIPEGEELPIAFFYGEDPVIRMSSDNGETWRDVVLPNMDKFFRPVVKRTIGFKTPEFGFAALGTEWSMGGSEYKTSYFTFDGGDSWIEKSLPLQGDSDLLIDIDMANEKEGIVALDSRMVDGFPLLYVTNDMGDSWTEVDIDFNTLPMEVQYLYDIESLNIEDDKYILILGQGPYGTKKATFISENLNGPWIFSSYKSSNIHSVG